MRKEMDRGDRRLAKQRLGSAAHDIAGFAAFGNTNPHQQMAPPGGAGHGAYRFDGGDTRLAEQGAAHQALA